MMREVGLKCIGFIGIPKVINNLAALRSSVDEDEELASKLNNVPRRHIGDEQSLKKSHEAAYNLWNDIYQPHSDKLLHVLGHSHPDLPVFIVEGEYGPLFSMPDQFNVKLQGKGQPIWEVNRLRTSLVAMAALRAQGGVGPQVTSHVWGLLKAKSSISQDDVSRNGLEWLCSEEGALWAIRAIDGVSFNMNAQTDSLVHGNGSNFQSHFQICEAVEGAEQHETTTGRQSKL